MYNNIGDKIKTLAKVIFIVEAIIAVLIGIIMIFVSTLFYSSDTVTATATNAASFLPGLIVLIVGPLVAWISSWTLYGFGELIEKTCEIAQNTKCLGNLTKTQSNVEQSPNKIFSTEIKNPPVKKENTVEDDSWVCGNCKRRNGLMNNTCWNCGNPK